MGYSILTSVRKHCDHCLAIVYNKAKFEEVEGRFYSFSHLDEKYGNEKVFGKDNQVSFALLKVIEHDQLTDD
jgi:hypothetical protein